MNRDVNDKEISVATKALSYTRPKGFDNVSQSPCNQREQSMKPTLHLSLLALALMLSPPAFPQGALAPTAAPAPIFKTLNQIEPRTPISSLPFTISQPGSYYLTRNLSGASGQNGISIGADNVNLDLMGFTITGAGTTGIGIVAAGHHKNITVVNGVIQTWGEAGLKFDSSDTLSCILDQLVASGNGSSSGKGIFCNIPGTIIRRCSATANKGNGIECGEGGLILECSSLNNTGFGFIGGDGCVFRDCMARGNGNASGGGIQAGNYSSLTNCSVSNNQVGASQFFTNIGVGSGCTVTNCIVGNSKGYGLTAGSGNTITGCAITDLNASGDKGIHVINGNTITGCTVRNVIGTALDLGASNLVKNNMLDFNAHSSGEAGIFINDQLNFLEGNSITATPVAISFDTSYTVAVHNNFAFNNSNPFVFAPGAAPSFVGQTIKTADLNGNAFIANTSNPWANFELH